MPSKKRRRRAEEEPESVWSIIAEALAEGVVRTVTAEANKLAEEFLAQNTMGKKANIAKSPGGKEVGNANPPEGGTESDDDDDDTVVEGTFKYVD